MANKIIDSLTYGSDSYTFSTPYGTCATSAATAAKVVTCANFLVLEAGARVAVKFTYANSASAPTLNVNGTGAKTIKCTGFTLTNMWAAGSVIDFIYDGTNWCVAGYNVDTNTDTNTDTKVTSAANHYAPAEDTSALLSVDASSTTAATWNSTSLVTGVNLQRDAKGHVTGVTVDSIKMPANPAANAYPKVTYEWNKEYAAGGTAGYLLIGSFPMYDSNVTIDIDATTSTTYHGTVIIATQNVSTTSIGSAHKIVVYGDPNGAISSAIRVVWTSGSNHYKVYFVPTTWSKNLIHIRAMALPSAPDESKICTFTAGTAPSTTSGLTVENALRDNFARPDTVSYEIEDLEHRLVDGDITVDSATYAAYAQSANQLSTARTISLTGLVTGSATFNGSANCTINTRASTYLDALMTQNYCIAMGERVANTVSSHPPYLVANVGGSAKVTAYNFLTAKPGVSISAEWYSDGYLNTTTSSCEADFTITNNSPYTLTVYFYLKADWDDGDGAWITGSSDRLSYEVEAGEVVSGTTNVRCDIDGRLYNDYPLVKIEALGYDMSSTL